MISLSRTNSNNPDFRNFVMLLDEILSESDGQDHPFFAQYNKLDSIKNVVIAYSENIPAGCGAIKEYSKNIAEIKRMFVIPEFRRQGIAKIILNELELWADELNYSQCILETGRKLSKAVNLYKSCGYEVIPSYGQYIGQELSICMKKRISSK